MPGKMKQSRRPSIRSRLALLVAACIVPALLMAVTLISYNYLQARQQLEQNAVMTARAMALVLDKEIAIAEATLATLATSANLARDDFAAFDRQAREVLPGQKVNNIVLSDINGKQYVNTLRPFGEALPQNNPNPPLKVVNLNGKPAISDLFMGPVSKRFAVAVGVPVRRADGVPYCLSASIFTENFSKLLRQQSLPPDWIAVTLDKAGVIVARTHEMPRFVGQKAVAQLLESLDKADEGVFEGLTKDGIPVFGAFSRAPNTGWTVAVGIPQSHMSAELRQNFSWLVLATVLILAGSLSCAWMIGGKIARAVRGLVAPALALGAGKAIEMPAFNLREADEVGAALAQAQAMLRQAQYLANHDVLTGLANRALLIEILDQQLVLCARHHSHLAVLYVDLDGFKQVNDENGHAVGDKLLQAVAERFAAAIRKSDVAARFGGDEFAVVLVDTTGEAAAAVAAKLLESLSAPYRIDRLTLEISASIGVAAYPHAGASSKILLHRADDAMYRAKAMGKRRVVMADN
jgi:diguanylate cyclase (GGDEF)-like protein